MTKWHVWFRCFQLFPHEQRFPKSKTYFSSSCVPYIWRLCSFRRISSAHLWFIDTSSITYFLWALLHDHFLFGWPKIWYISALLAFVKLTLRTCVTFCPCKKNRNECSLLGLVVDSLSVTSPESVLAQCLHYPTLQGLSVSLKWHSQGKIGPSQMV